MYRGGTGCTTAMMIEVVKRGYQMHYKMVIEGVQRGIQMHYSGS